MSLSPTASTAEMSTCPSHRHHPVPIAMKLLRIQDHFVARPRLYGRVHGRTPKEKAAPALSHV
ncbi:hypothetical protein GQ600_17160 [Phytophthora cactorum]|nr:hypothetical protein GQ600_17160 [Phytophthora cactorum]